VLMIYVRPNIAKIDENTDNISFCLRCFNLLSIEIKNKTCQTKLYRLGALHYIKLKIGKLKANHLPKTA